MKPQAGHAGASGRPHFGQKAKSADASKPQAEQFNLGPSVPHPGTVAGAVVGFPTFRVGGADDPSVGQPGMLGGGS